MCHSQHQFHVQSLVNSSSSLVWPHHIETDLERYITVEHNGWITLRDDAFPE
jgi:hypothetical protein